MTKQELMQIKSNGFTYAYSEDGAHFFQKCINNSTQDKFQLMRCLDSDLTNGNFEYFTKNGYSNFNEVPQCNP